jgi:hypothetical protein
VCERVQGLTPRRSAPARRPARELPGTDYAWNIYHCTGKSFCITALHGVVRIKEVTREMKW